MTDDVKHLEALLIDMKESLEREMREGFERRADFTTLTRTLTKQETAIRDLQARVRKRGIHRSDAAIPTRLRRFL